jgi:hypothetical protein
MRKAGNGELTNSRKRSRHLQPADESPAPKLRCVDSTGQPSEDLSAAPPSAPQENEQTAVTGADCVGYGYSPVTGELLVRYPIDVVSHREGIHKCDVAGKQSLSGFRFLGYRPDDDTSLVECRPHTGRTHQLRLHLQLLGNPIANDPCYGGLNCPSPFFGSCQPPSPHLPFGHRDLVLWPGTEEGRSLQDC